VLRLIVGISAIIEGVLAILAAHSISSIVAPLVGAIAGLALTIGFVTPVASGLLGAMGAVLLLSQHSALLRLLDSRMALLEFVALAVALVILGPGATSVDAGLFGRRVVSIRSGQRPEDP